MKSLVTRVMLLLFCCLILESAQASVRYRQMEKSIVAKEVKINKKAAPKKTTVYVSPLAGGAIVMGIGLLAMIAGIILKIKLMWILGLIVLALPPVIGLIYLIVIAVFLSGFGE